MVHQAAEQASKAATAGADGVHNLDYGWRRTPGLIANIERRAFRAAGIEKGGTRIHCPQFCKSALFVVRAEEPGYRGM